MIMTIFNIPLNIKKMFSQKCVKYSYKNIFILNI